MVEWSPRGNESKGNRICGEPEIVWAKEGFLISLPPGFGPNAIHGWDTYIVTSESKDYPHNDLELPWLANPLPWSNM